MLPESTKCSGCGSCAAVCPKDCITMAPDAEGFRYPVIDEARCVRCGLCGRACPVAQPPAVSGETSAFAAQNADEAVRRDSSSGGVFTALAARTFAQNGRVCAAVYDPDFQVRHVLADSPDQLAAMRGAKYAQSQAEHCFPQIRELLNNDVPVLFVGTPCQCAGLRIFLGRDEPRLLLVDMVCHGVPSPKVWQHYLRERRMLDAPEGQLLSVNLRSKATGWSRYSYSVEYGYSGGIRRSTPQGQDPFMRGFVSNLYLRPSCADCAAKGAQRCSDLTLGDYWGIWDQHPQFDDNRGTSLLLVHSPKGQLAWEQIAGDFRSLTVTLEEALAQNPSALQSSPPHPSREAFFSGLEQEHSIIRRIEHCLAPKRETVVQRLLRRIRRE